MHISGLLCVRCADTAPTKPSWTCAPFVLFSPRILGFEHQPKRKLEMVASQPPPALVSFFCSVWPFDEPLARHYFGQALKVCPHLQSSFFFLFVHDFLTVTPTIFCCLERRVAGEQCSVLWNGPHNEKSPPLLHS